ncbi:unnamed protein product [Brassica oleracea var. botrytis]
MFPLATCLFSVYGCIRNLFFICLFVVVSDRLISTIWVGFQRW